VVEKNKLQYLNLLAQYRLAKCVREEIDHFLKGGKLSPALFGAVDPDKLYVHCLECIIISLRTSITCDAVTGFHPVGKFPTKHQSFHPKQMRSK